MPAQRLQPAHPAESLAAYAHAVAVFKNSTEIKNSEASEFEKIRCESFLKT
jgi:hypothetical protein